MSRDDVEQRVRRAAEAALLRRKFVSAIDVLLGLGWLSPALEAEWRQGRVDYLERVAHANLSKISHAMAAFRRWARDCRLRPSETAYVARTRDRRPLRFSKSGEPAIERSYRTHFVSPELGEKKRERLQEKLDQPPELVVVSPVKEWSCRECGGSGELLFVEGGGPLCLSCADLDHLIFLPRGDAALTRRASTASRLRAVVVRWSRARGRYERQGVLVEATALEKAEAECLTDGDIRERRRAREQGRREALDLDLARSMAQAIRSLFPGCPPDEAGRIAEHASLRGSGRIGRSRLPKSFSKTGRWASSVRAMDSNVLRIRSVGRPARIDQNPRRPRAREPGAPPAARPALSPLEATAVRAPRPCLLGVALSAVGKMARGAPRRSP